jgi:hypothetical protein
MSINTRWVFYFIVTGLILNGVFLLFSQINMDTSQQATGTPVSTWYSQLGFIGNLLLTAASIISFAMFYRRFPVFLSCCYIGLVLIIAAMSAPDFDQYLKTPSLFYLAKGLGSWINFGLLYFMADDHYSAKVLKIFKWLCYCFILFNLIKIAQFGAISNREQAENAIRDTSVFLFWVYPFFFLSSADETPLFNAVKYLLMIFVLFFAFAISSRSYTMIMAIFILIKVVRDLRYKKNAAVMTVMAILLCVGGCYLLLNIQNFKSLNDLLTIFSGRIDDDSRTGQLKEFFSQYNTDNLFKGVGITGTWNWSGDRSGKYPWLDNQFVLVTWWFGIETTLLYICFLLNGLVKKNVNSDRTITNAKLLVFFWLLACAGFAIYVTISSTLFYYFITLMIGLVTLKKKYITVTLVKQGRIESEPSIMNATH